MDIKELKGAMRLMKTASLELEQEAMKEGISPASRQFRKLQDKLREKILEHSGYSVEEYVAAKTSFLDEEKKKKEESTIRQ